MNAEYWEPWQPEVGQRVRVHLSGECQRLMETRVERLPFGGRELTGHPQEMDGVTGIVVPIEPWMDITADHPYVVRFDEPLRLPEYGVGRCLGTVFAAIELEPVS